MNEERSVIRYEIFHPTQNNMHSKQWEEEEIPTYPGFTLDKEYPIFQERVNMGSKSLNSIRYETIDDEGRPRLVPHWFFVQKIKLLEGDGYLEDKPEFEEFLGRYPELGADIRRLATIKADSNQLNWSGLPDLIFNFEALFTEARKFLAIAGVNKFEPYAEVKTKTDHHVECITQHLKALKEILSNRIKMDLAQEVDYLTKERRR